MKAPLTLSQLENNLPQLYKANAPLQFTFLGTGTSGGVPEVACSCDVCISNNPKNKRFRCCAFIENEWGKVLIDCGPDIRSQALAHKINKVDAILYTHDHADHNLGINDLRNISFQQGKAIDLFGKRETIESMQNTFPYLFGELKQWGGGVVQITPYIVEYQPFYYLGFKIEPLPVTHGSLEINGYLINDKIAYITDASFLPEITIKKITNIPILILNALRYKPHSTHFNVEESVEISKRVNAGQTYLTHFTHNIDHENLSKELPEKVSPAFDGLSFTV